MKNKKSKSIIIVILHVVSIFCILLWYVETMHRDNIANMTTVESIDGVWDLSECDFSDTIFKLEGDMEYINGFNLSLEEFEANSDKIKIGNFDDFGTVITAKGTIVFPDDNDSYHLKVTSLSTKALYIDDVFSGSNGIGNSEQKSYNHQNEEITTTFSPLDNETELIIHSSDFIHSSDADLFQIYIGDPTLLDWYFDLGEQVQTLVIGMLFMLFILHIVILFSFEKSSLSAITSIFCLIWSVRFGLEESGYFYTVFPFFPWELGFRVVNSAIPLSGIPIVWLVTKQFKGTLSNKQSYAIIFISGLLALYVFFASVSTITDRSLIIYGSYILLAIYLSYALIRYLRIKNREIPLTSEQKVSTVPFFVLFYAVVHDSFYSLGIHLFFISYTITEMSILYFAVCETLILFSNNVLKKQEAEVKEHEARIEAEELDRFSKIKSHFMGIVAHEIKTPLAIINGGASETKDLLEDMLDKTAIEQCEEEIEWIGRNQMVITKTVKDLNETVFDLLDATALETGRLTLNKIEINLCDFITSVAEQHRIQVEKANNKLILDFPLHKEKIYCDVRRIRQVLINVLSNALRYTNNGEIKVSIDISGRYQVITISDTGLGMTTDVLHKLKQKSYIDGGPHGNRGGIGIYVCHQIIESHHGTLEITSDSGFGTKVTISLPRTTEKTR